MIPYRVCLSSATPSLQNTRDPPPPYGGPIGSGVACRRRSPTEGVSIGEKGQ